MHRTGQRCQPVATWQLLNSGLGPDHDERSKARPEL
jgi:hypothetical protein